VKDTFDLLNFPKGYSPRLIPSGCCGMAGSFGFEKQHYSVSQKMAELQLLPAVRRAEKDTVIVANGTSCRHQIRDGAHKTAVHPITALRWALRS
jgi:Fe-S oxidoreductase